MGDAVAEGDPEYRAIQQIWSMLPGSQALFERYGHYPTMHDAKFLRIAMNSPEHATTIDFYCIDRPDGLENDIHTIFTMRWIGVVWFQHYFEDNRLSEIKLNRANGLIETTMLDSSKSVWGTIIAERIKISNVEAPPPEWDRDNKSIKDIKGFHLMFHGNPNGVTTTRHNK